MDRGCVVGKRYETRFGWTTLVERNVAAVESTLLPVSSDTAVVAPGFKGVQFFATAQVRDLLNLFLVKAALECERKADGGYYAVAPITVSSIYRELGTTAGSGIYGDPCGCIDSTDGWGHWSGWCVDFPTKFFRWRCVPTLTVAEVNAALLEAGLVRPFYRGPRLTSYPQGYGEWWHWRPGRITT